MCFVIASKNRTLKTSQARLANHKFSLSLEFACWLVNSAPLWQRRRRSCISLSLVLLHVAPILVLCIDVQNSLVKFSLRLEFSCWQATREAILATSMLWPITEWDLGSNMWRFSKYNNLLLLRTSSELHQAESNTSFSQGWELKVVNKTDYSDISTSIFLSNVKIPRALDSNLFHRKEQ